MKKILSSHLLLPLLISCFFFLAYVVMGIIRQQHFLSGYDIAVVDQAIWKYSHFKAPISTNHAYAFTPILWDHVELIYLLIAPLYWVYDNINTLIILQAFAISSSGIAVFLLARKYQLKHNVSLALVISYLSFYGIQNAIWADVHSLVFGVACLAWFLYFAENNNSKLTWLFFFLSIMSKEDIALLTVIISGTLFFTKKNKLMLWFVGISIVYLWVIFFVYFPHFVPGGYRFQSAKGLFANIHLSSLYNTTDKRDVLLYSSLWYGFIPFASPLYLLGALADVAKYFVVGNDVVSSGQSIFGHYRSSLAILLAWPAIVTLSKVKKVNTWIISFYILGWALMIQYLLHLPLSYFAKKWFWTPSPSVASMREIIKRIPPTASVVTQINMLPHLSHRDLEFVMWPQLKTFTHNSPCGKSLCNWFHWPGHPEYMIVDTSTDWDARYWLTNRTEFVDGVNNLKKAGVIKQIQTIGTTSLYRVVRQP